MKRTKKTGQVTFNRSWVEIFFLFFLLIGFYISATSGNELTSYIIIIFTGFLSGRIIYSRKGLFKFGYIVIILGFLIGYIIGSFIANNWIIIMLFILTNILSYILHNKKII